MFTCNIGSEREKIGRKYVWVCVCVCMYSRAYVRMINKEKKGQIRFPPKTFLGKTQQRGYVLTSFSLPCIL